MFDFKPIAQRIIQRARRMAPSIKISGPRRDRGAVGAGCGED